MALADLSDPQAVLDAIAEFDSLGRDEFLSRYGFGRARDYFVESHGQLYDSKAITGAAHGYQWGTPLTADQFSGGDATVAAKLESLGFTVARRTADAVAAMSLRECLQGVRTLGYDAKLGPGQPAQVHLREARRAVDALLPPLGYRVKVSGAAVNLPKAPWLSILDPSVTTTARSGIYVVYLFSLDVRHVFLTVNQGATAHQVRAREQRPAGMTVDGAALASLTAETAAIRAGIDGSLLRGLGTSISLGGSGFLPRAYEAGTIAAVTYDLDHLPDDSVLDADLARFLTLYDAAVAARVDLTATDPATYSTPAIATLAPSREPVFRPKDSSDYVAAVRAHVQVKTRRHESVLKAFGERARANGWTPDTGVHPRDLVLRRDGVEVLCEVKTVGSNAEFAVREAIGQLLTYSHFLYVAQGAEPPSGLLAVFSGPVGDAFVAFLDTIGIASVWATGGAGWAGSASARGLGVV